MRLGRACLVTALLAAACGAASAQEAQIGRGVTTTRNITDWRAYFSGDMRELLTRSASRTVYDASDNPPVRVGGIDFDVTSTSPVESASTSRYVVWPAAPDFGTVYVDSRSTTANGLSDETSFRFALRQPAPPIVIGPIDGQEIELPARERVIAGKTFRIRSTSRTVAIEAIVVAPTVEDLIAGRAVREVREPGAKLVQGSMRVVSPAGELLGYYAGDVRVVHNEDFAAPR